MVIKVSELKFKEKQDILIISNHLPPNKYLFISKLNAVILKQGNHLSQMIKANISSDVIMISCTLQYDPLTRAHHLSGIHPNNP